MSTPAKKASVSDYIARIIVSSVLILVFAVLGLTSYFWIKQKTTPPTSDFYHYVHYGDRYRFPLLILPLGGSPQSNIKITSKPWGALRNATDTNDITALISGIKSTCQSTSKGALLANIQLNGVSAFLEIDAIHGTSTINTAPTLKARTTIPGQFLKIPSYREALRKYISQLNVAVNSHVTEGEITTILAIEQAIADCIADPAEERKHPEDSATTTDWMYNNHSGFWREFAQTLNIPHNMVLHADHQSLEKIGTLIESLTPESLITYGNWCMARGYAPFANSDAFAAWIAFSEAIGLDTANSMEGELENILSRLAPGEVTGTIIQENDKTRIRAIEDAIMAEARSSAKNLPGTLATRAAKKLSTLVIANPWENKTPRRARLPKSTNRIQAINELYVSYTRDSISACGKPSNNWLSHHNLEVNNAWYNRTINRIAIGAQILAPMSNGRGPQMSTGELYGTIGYVIGHEISHSIDGYNIYFDESGTFVALPPAEHQWVSHRTGTLINALRDYPSEEKENFEIKDGEALSDIGGLELAFRALNKELKILHANSPEIMASERRKFFEAFARSRQPRAKGNRRTYLNMLAPHPAAELRVNVSLSLFPEFASLYNGDEPAAQTSTQKPLSLSIWPATPCDVERN